MPKIKLKLSDRLKLDPDKIEEQLCEHPHYLYLAGVRLANGKAARDQARDEYREAQAAVYRQLRAVAADEGVKVTETALVKDVDLHADVIASRRIHRAAEQTVDKAQSLYDAFQSRGYLLRNLSDIHMTESYQTRK